MSDDTTTHTLELIDKVTAPAKQADAALPHLHGADVDALGHAGAHVSPF